MSLVIRRWCESDSVDELTDLVRRAYAVLAENGLNYVGTTQDSEVTVSRMKDGETWVALDDEAIVGSVIYYPPGVMTDCEYLAKNRPPVFGQFAVDPSRQGQGNGKLLIARIEEVARQDGASELVCDTSEQAVDLIAMYKKWGFEIVGKADWRPLVNYKSVVLARKIL